MRPNNFANLYAIYIKRITCTYNKSINYLASLCGISNDNFKTLAGVSLLTVATAVKSARVSAAEIRIDRLEIVFIALSLGQDSSAFPAK